MQKSIKIYINLNIFSFLFFKEQDQFLIYFKFIFFLFFKEQYQPAFVFGNKKKKKNGVSVAEFSCVQTYAIGEWVNACDYLF